MGVALLTARSLTTVLFGVSPTDLRAMAGVPIVLVTLAALACLAPGRRAAKLDPAEILRENAKSVFGQSEFVVNSALAGPAKSA